jgi:hypothetical protein
MHNPKPTGFWQPLTRIGALGFWKKPHLGCYGQFRIIVNTRMGMGMIAGMEIDKP